jgi:hypothetical protein
MLVYNLEWIDSVWFFLPGAEAATNGTAGASEESGGASDPENQQNSVPPPPSQNQSSSSSGLMALSDEDSVDPSSYVVSPPSGSHSLAPMGFKQEPLLETDPRYA